MVFERAGKKALSEDLIDVKAVKEAYYELIPNVDDPSQKVSFGTSGHRGASQKSAFNQAHIVATTKAIVEYRKLSGINGPTYIGPDTHLLSGPAFESAVEVLVANGIETYIDSRHSFVPTPAVSHAILRHNLEANGQLPTGAFEASIETPYTGDKDGATKQLADGIVVTPSHNPPTDGGFKYNPAHGGPADADATSWIQDRANELIKQGWEKIERIEFDQAIKSDLVNLYDYRDTYVQDLKNIIDMDAIREAGVKIGADPLGGAATEYWPYIAEVYGLNLTVTNPLIDPRWPEMTLDWDGKIRMDCSSPYSMQGLVDSFNENPGLYDIGTGNDADSDRHGIVLPNALTKSTGTAGIDPNGEYIAGLMNPNHFLAVCIHYLFGGSRPNWPKNTKIGKTLVSSSLIDRVSKGINRDLSEVPVGFKWFVTGLIDASFGFGGEESAGASFLRLNGTVWTTDKDGLILDLLASEIIAKTGKNPAEIHRELIGEYGQSWYQRIDAPATLEEKAKLKGLSPDDVTATELAGESIEAKLTNAPGNGAAIGGLKVVTKNAWFAARPSGTENVYKIYAESFISPEHLKQVQEEAKKVVAKAIA